MAAPHISAVLRQLPPNARRLVQVGWRDGDLIDAYKSAYPSCLYQLVEADAAKAGQGRRHCEVVHQARIDGMGADFYAHFAQADGWLFDQTLAASSDPLALLRRLRQTIAADACVIVILPNSARFLLPWQTDWSSPAGMAALLAQAGYTAAAAVALHDWPAELLPHAGADPQHPSHYLLKAYPA